VKYNTLLRTGAPIATAFLVGFSVIALWKTRNPNSPGSSTVALEISSTAPDLAIPAEIVLVYIGRRSCGPSNRPEVGLAVRAGLRALSDFAERRELAFRTIGIAPDQTEDLGREHLSGIADFHELSAGGGWSSLMFERFVSSLHRGPAATPQVIVLWRGPTLPTSLGQTSTPTTTVAQTEIELFRAVGVSEMSLWRESGSRLPRLALERLDSIQSESHADVAPRRRP
jgi:hypothetical protein